MRSSKQSMIAKSAVLLVSIVVGTVSCAAGTEELEPSPLDTSATPPPAQPGDPPGTEESGATPPPASYEVSGSYALDVACADVPVIDVCLLDSNADKDVVFELPAGTTRSSIVYSVEPEGPDASGSVAWASEDVLDATVHLHGHAGAFSSVHIEVTGVMVTPDD